MARGWSKTESFEDRFYRQVNKTNGCWIWTGHLDFYGYGVMGYKMKAYRSSRASYIIHYGPIPKGLGVLHKCNNRKCVNPDHLYAGNQKQNVDDCIKSGRHNKWQKNGMAKLTNKQVIEIKNLLKQGRFFDREIAARFNVSRTCIGLIKKGRRWASLTGEL